MLPVVQEHKLSVMAAWLKSLFGPLRVMTRTDDDVTDATVVPNAPDDELDAMDRRSHDVSPCVSAHETPRNGCNDDGDCVFNVPRSVWRDDTVTPVPQNTPATDPAIPTQNCPSITQNSTDTRRKKRRDSPTREQSVEPSICKRPQPSSDADEQQLVCDTIVVVPVAPPTTNLGDWNVMLRTNTGLTNINELAKQQAAAIIAKQSAHNKKVAAKVAKEAAKEAERAKQKAALEAKRKKREAKFAASQQRLADTTNTLCASNPPTDPVVDALNAMTMGSPNSQCEPQSQS